MAVCTKLLEKRKEAGECEYNGYLQEYMQDHDLDPVLQRAFVQIAEELPEMHLCAGLRSHLSASSVTNRIIRCGELLQINERPLYIPYILYDTHRGSQRALFVFPYEPYGELYARGLFYCLTEQGAEFEQERNEIVYIASSRAKDIIFAANAMHDQKASILQRRLVQNAFSNTNVIYYKACQAAQSLQEDACHTIRTHADATGLVLRWFYLRKLVYVQYLMDKTILQNEHNGDKKAQRSAAKVRADSLACISYKKLCRMAEEV